MEVLHIIGTRNQSMKSALLSRPQTSIWSNCFPNNQICFKHIKVCQLNAQTRILLFGGVVHFLVRSQNRSQHLGNSPGVCLANSGLEFILHAFNLRVKPTKFPLRFHFRIWDQTSGRWSSCYCSYYAADGGPESFQCSPVSAWTISFLV